MTSAERGKLLRERLRALRGAAFAFVAREPKGTPQAKPKDEAHTIPLDLLGQPQPAAYRLGAGDVLGIFIQNLLGEEKLPVTVNVGLVQYDIYWFDVATMQLKLGYSKQLSKAILQ